MDAVDRRIVNALQGGFPISDRPFAEAAEGLGISEAELIRRLRDMLAEGVLSRFGPLYHAERLGGGLTLAAMAVPEDRFDAVIAEIEHETDLSVYSMPKIEEFFIGLRLEA